MMLRAIKSTRPESSALLSIQKLLNSSPNYPINRRNEAGETLLMIAVQAGHESVVNYIINNAVDLDVDVTSKSNNTALTLATRKNEYNINIITLLVRSGACVSTILHDTNNSLYFPNSNSAKVKIIAAIKQGSVEYRNNLLSVIQSNCHTPLAQLPIVLIDIIAQYVTSFEV
jgi:ankyrin repeat protein